MWITVVSVGIAMVAAFVITTSVTAATRRSDQRRRERGEALPSEDGALVTIRLRTFQWMIIRVVAVVFVVVGLLMALAFLAVAEDGAEAGMAVAALAILLAGVGGVALSRSMRRTRVLAMADHLLVRQGFRQERRVELGEIAAILPIANQYGGLQARDAAGKRLFSVMGLARGYTELQAYLDERVVRPRTVAPAPPGPDGVSVPTWRGAGISADRTLTPLGYGGKPRPTVRLWIGDAVFVLHVSDVRAVVDGRTTVAETVSAPVAFLTVPGAVDPAEPLGRQVAGLAPESLVLVHGPAEPLVAVIRDSDADTFRAWVGGLPR